MCGIVAYIGNGEAYPVLINGLKRLEYRGYDSAGVALIEIGSILLSKKKGKVSNLVDMNSTKEFTSKIGIGHTRWATHGEPNDINAHPHFSQSGKLAMIHNGIIENYGTLKKGLEKKGYSFKSETDTEVFISFIEEVKASQGISIEEALRLALHEVAGAYAIAILSEDEPNKIWAAKKGSPMVIGVGKDELFIASDATPIIEYTKDVIYLNDGELAILESNAKYTIKDISNKEQTPYIHQLEMDLEAIEKSGYDYFMLKEIMEQPNSVADSMRGRMDLEHRNLTLGGIQKHAETLVNAEKITILACGTSWHAGLVAEYLIEDLCRIPVEVEYASEFRYRNPIINQGDVVIAISQSGETADTLAAIELSKSKGAIVLGVVNGVGSSIARATHEGAYLHAGPEIGVASTKAFTSQITVLAMMAMKMALRKQTISQQKFDELMHELSQVPEKIDEVLKLNNHIESIAHEYYKSENCLYLGRGYNFPVALEGALKLKEISYIHAEGYPAAEMKHGPIALIDEEMPVIFIATRDSSYDKIVSNIQEVKSRKGKIIAVVTKGDVLITQMADHVIEVPPIDEHFMPLVSVIPLQLLSYHIALLRGCNVDQPRNLAKSVTVE